MSEQARKEFERWMQHADGEILEELQRIEHDPEEIEKRFGHKQTFGTAGIRSVMAAGIANLNTYTVRQTARGLAAYLAGVPGEKRCAIGYDCRHNSRRFAEICAAAKNLGSAFLKGYAQMLIDAANLRSAVRTMRMNKDTEFLKTALIPGGGIDTGRILAAFGSGDTLASIYANTLLENAAALGAAAVKGGTMTEFELACDNAVTAYLTGARLVSYGEAPAIAYLAAVEGETTALRMILTGMLAGLPTETIRERLRDLYA